MDINQHHKRPAPDPHFERLHSRPLKYALAIQSFLQSYHPQPPSDMDSPADPSGFSRPTVPSVADFTKEKVSTTEMPPPPTTGLQSDFQTCCQDACSVTNCESGCNPSVLDSGTCSLSQCNNLEECTSEECCRESACLDHISIPTSRRQSIDFRAEDQYDSSSHNQFANDDTFFPAYDFVSGYDNIDDHSVQCHWLLPDQECDITAPTKDALSQHVLHDHIQTETSLMCGWSDCEEQVNVQQLADHLWHSHHPEQSVPDSYICLWHGCKETFPDDAQLEKHMEVAHTHMENIDCRWGGCSTITTNPTELQSHVNQEHLHIDIPPGPPSSAGPSSRFSSLQPRNPCFWSPENDDSLLSGRAKGLSFKQISDQYLPDRSAVACKLRFVRIRNKEQQSVSQSTEKSTSILASPYATSPYESKYPLVDASLSQASPDILSKRSTDLVQEAPPAEGSHACMWVTDDSTETICGVSFAHPNEVQSHIESCHYPFSDERKRRPISHWTCNWRGCIRRGETRGTRDKLRKHVFTHTKCELSFVTRMRGLAHTYQSILFLAAIAPRRLVIATNLPITYAPIRRRNPTSAMCVRWPLLAEMD